jgi:hypothetical protein
MPTLARGKTARNVLFCLYQTTFPDSSLCSRFVPIIIIASHDGLCFLYSRLSEFLEATSSMKPGELWRPVIPLDERRG